MCVSPGTKNNMRRCRMQTLFFATRHAAVSRARDSRVCTMDGKVGGSPKAECVNCSEQMTGRESSTSRRVSYERSWFTARVPSEEGKNYVLHFSNCQLLHPPKPRSLWKAEKYKIGRSESHREKNVKSGGSDPTFSAFSRPKSSWGRSRPEGKPCLFFSRAQRFRRQHT